MSRSLLSRVFSSSTPADSRAPEYVPVENDELLANADEVDAQQQHEFGDGEEDEDDTVLKKPFSWHDYAVFLLLGVAMLWAWYVFDRLGSSLSTVLLLYYVFRCGVCWQVNGSGAN